MFITYSAITVLRAWRFLCCLAMGVTLGFPLGHLLGPIAGFALVFFTVGFGIIWQGRHIAGIPLFASVPSPPISKPVAFLGFSFIGAIWGGFASEVLGSPLGGAFALTAAVALVGAWYTVVLNRHGQLNHLLFALFSLLSGLGGLYAFSTLSA